MDKLPYPYPTSASGLGAERGKEYFPRKDAALSAEELAKIQTSDPDRWLVEWTYRVPDVADSVGDLGDFLEGLMLKYLQAMNAPARTAKAPMRLGVNSKIGLVEIAVGTYRAGHRSLLQTCQAIRHGLGGYVFDSGTKLTKDDPEYRHAVSNVFRRMRNNFPHE